MVVEVEICLVTTAVLYIVNSYTQGLLALVLDNHHYLVTQEVAAAACGALASEMKATRAEGC